MWFSLWDGWSFNYSIKFKMKIIILRIYSVYGEKNKKQLFWDVCNKIKRKENIFFGTGEEVRSWLHIDDLISAILKIKNIDILKSLKDLNSNAFPQGSLKNIVACSPGKPLNRM